MVAHTDGKARPEKEYVPKSGRAAAVQSVRVTMDQKLVAQVACKRASKMKRARCLASGRGDLFPFEIVNLYARRFMIEERFRDTKNQHVGMGPSAVCITSCDRRD